MKFPRPYCRSLASVFGLAVMLLLSICSAVAQTYSTYDMVVPVSTQDVLTTVDGTGRILPTNRSYVIALAGGTRGAILIQNFVATAQYPLIIVNQAGTGKVVITDATATTKRDGITVRNCKYFQLRGDNDPAYRYGIEVAQVGSKVGHAHLGVSITGTSSDGEIKFLEVHDSGFAGIMIKSDPSCSDSSTWAANFVMQNINVHDNYVHGTGGEGMYIGYTHWTDVLTCGADTVLGHEIWHLRVSYNLVEHTTWESIQVASDPVDTKLFENVMFSAGETPASGQGSNLQIGGGATGEYFNNIMIGAYYNNVSCTGQASAVSVYNNLMVNAGDYAIFAKNLPEPAPTDPNARQTQPGSFVNFFNNTIVNPANGCYYTLDHVSTNTFQNNICMIPNMSFTEVLTGNGALVTADHNLLKRTVGDLNFVDTSGLAQQNDYRIQSSSLAVDAGTSLAGLTSPQIPVTTDFFDNARPQGSAYDIGFHEVGPLSVYLIATPPTTSGGTGSIKAAVVGGTTPYTYAWSNSATTQTISGVTQGLYSVTVSDAAGATMSRATYLIDGATMGAPVRLTPPGEVIPPTISPTPGAFSTPQVVTLSCATSGATIRYTTDGSIPTATTGNVYNVAISVPQTAVITAVGVKSGMTTSLPTAATYIINNGATDAKFTGLTASESTHTGSNVVAYTIDGDLGTRWAANTDGAYVQYDFGVAKRLGSFSVSWYSGATRNYNFDFLVSADGTNWTTVLGGHQSPKAAGLQSYDIPEQDNVRYARIVCHGYVGNATATSIEEVEFWGGNPGTAIAAAITTQPNSQTVSVGDTASFSVIATGTPAPTYQWFVDGLLIPGATSSSLTITNAQSTDAGDYTVVVSNYYGSVTSSVATLTVNSGSLGQLLQAEDAVLSGALVKNNQTGYTGTGFADYINLSGDYVEWTATMPASGSRTLTFRYASTGSPRNLSISVNGTVVNSALSFTTTGGANIWALKTMTATLPAGTVTIRATATGTSGPNMDYLKID